MFTIQKNPVTPKKRNRVLLCLRVPSLAAFVWNLCSCARKLEQIGA